MHKYLCVGLGIVLAVAALALTTVEGWSLPMFTVKQSSNLFKGGNCSSDPTGCSWCTTDKSCYHVTECKGGKCTVVALSPPGPSVSTAETAPSKVTPATRHLVLHGATKKK